MARSVRYAEGIVRTLVALTLVNKLIFVSKLVSGLRSVWSLIFEAVTRKTYPTVTNLSQWHHDSNILDDISRINTDIFNFRRLPLEKLPICELTVKALKSQMTLTFKPIWPYPSFIPDSFWSASSLLTKLRETKQGTFA